MTKIVHGGSWVAGSIGILSGIFNLVDRYMSLEYQNRQSRMMHDEAILEISERAGIIRAKIESDAKNFDKCTRLAIEKHEQAFAKIANLIEKEIADTLNSQNRLSLAFDEINQRLIQAESEHELKVCLKAQLILTGAMNEGITSLQKVLAVEAKRLKTQAQKLLEG